jgi:hypothetical protein
MLIYMYIYISTKVRNQKLGTRQDAEENFWIRVTDARVIETCYLSTFMHHSTMQVTDNETT